MSCNLILGIAAITVATNVYDTHEYGNYIATQLFSQLFLNILVLAPSVKFQSNLIREYSPEGQIGNQLGLTLVGAPLAFLFTLIFRSSFVEAGVAATIFLLSSMQLEWMFIHSNRYGFLLFRTAASKLALIASLVYLHGAEFNAIAASYILSFFISSSMTVIVLRRLIAPSIKNVHLDWKRDAVFSANSIIGQLYSTIDLIIISKFVDSGTLAQLSITRSILSGLLVFPSIYLRSRLSKLGFTLSVRATHRHFAREIPILSFVSATSIIALFSLVFSIVSGGATAPSSALVAGAFLVTAGLIYMDVIINVPRYRERFTFLGNIISATVYLTTLIAFQPTDLNTLIAIMISSEALALVFVVTLSHRKG